MKGIHKFFKKLFPCRHHEPLCAGNFFGCRCGKGETQITYPQAPPQPTTAEGIQAWVGAMPQVFAEQMRQAPLQAQQQIGLMQQYALPYGQAYQQAQEAMYPGTSALQEQLAGQAQAGMGGQVPDWMREQYQSDLRANLGTNIGSGIGADYTSRGLLQQQQDWKSYYQNLGLSLTGRQPLAQPTMPQTGQYAQQFQPQSVMDYMQQGYGTFAQATRPFTTQGKQGTSLGFLGQWGSY